MSLQREHLATFSGAADLPPVEWRVSEGFVPYPDALAQMDERAAAIAEEKKATGADRLRGRGSWSVPRVRHPSVGHPRGGRRRGLIGEQLDVGQATYQKCVQHGARRGVIGEVPGAGDEHAERHVVSMGSAGCGLQCRLRLLHRHP